MEDDYESRVRAVRLTSLDPRIEILEVQVDDPDDLVKISNGTGSLVFFDSDRKDPHLWFSFPSPSCTFIYRTRRLIPYNDVARVAADRGAIRGSYA